jgi:hypothetical protein
MTIVKTILPLCIAAAALVAPAIATAAPNLKPLPSPQWVKKPFVANRHVSNGFLKPSARILGVRSKRRGGGYNLIPACRVGNWIMAGTVEKASSKAHRVVCPQDGVVAVNGSRYTTEEKRTIEQRGRLSNYTVMYNVTMRSSSGSQPKWAGTQAICYANVAGQRLPGYMRIKDANKVPEACTVFIMGQKTEVKDYGVFVHKGASGIPRKGWARIQYNDVDRYQLPIHAGVLGDSALVCRTSKEPDGLAIGGILRVSNDKYFCVSRNGYDTRNLEVYLNDSRRPRWRAMAQDSKHVHWGHVFDFSRSVSHKEYVCRAPDGKGIGMVVKEHGEEICLPKKGHFSRMHLIYR